MQLYLFCIGESIPLAKRMVSPGIAAKRKQLVGLPQTCAADFRIALKRGTGHNEREIPSVSHMHKMAPFIATHATVMMTEMRA